MQDAARSMRPASTMPARAGVSPPPHATPQASHAFCQPLTSCWARALSPNQVGAARRPIGLHHQRRGADRDEVVDRHRNGVLRDAVVVALAGEAGHFIGHQGLGAQALDDGGDVEGADIHHVGRLAARGPHFVEAVRAELRRGGCGSALRVHLQRIDEVVLNARLFIAERRASGRGSNGIHRPIIDEVDGASLARLSEATRRMPAWHRWFSRASTGRAASARWSGRSTSCVP